MYEVVEMVVTVAFFVIAAVCIIINIKKKKNKDK